MRFIIVVVIVTGFFAIYKSKYGETKSNNTFIDAKKVPHRPIKMTLNERHKRQEWKFVQQRCNKIALKMAWPGRIS